MNRALFITVVDMYDNNGNGGVKGSQRNYELIQRIYGEENTILVTFPRKEYTCPPEGAIYFERTQSNMQHLIAALLGCKVYFPWKEKRIKEFIDEQKVNLLFIDSSMLGRLTRLKGEYRTVVFFHNVEANYAYNKVRNEGLKFLPSYWASKLNEKYAMKFADKVVSLNERDARELEALYGRKADFILPVTLSDKFDIERKMNTPKTDRLLFVGAYMPQNVVSIEWFIKEVLLYIDGVGIDIVGKGFEEKKNEYEQLGDINVIGTVDDLDSQYYSHSIVVLPIQYGAGMKIKTAEAMMYGMTIIASDEALEGYEVNEIEGVYRCNKPEEYITAINKVMNKQDESYKEVRERFLEKYETSKVIKEFKRFIYY